METYTPKNLNLYTRLKNLSSLAIEFLNECKANGQTITYRRKSRVEFNGEHNFSVSQESIPSFPIFIGKHEKEILDFAEATLYLNELKKTPYYKEKAYGMTLASFLTELTDKAGSLCFNLDVFDKVYSDFENLLYTGEIVYEAYGSLNDFSMGVNEVILDKNVTLRKMTESQFSEMIDFEYNPFDLLPSRYRIEVKYKIQEAPKKENNNPHCIAISTLHDVIYALRLFKEGDASFKKHYYLPRTWPVFAKGICSGPSIFHSRYRLCSYELKEEEVNKFIEFWGKYKCMKEKFSSHSYLSTAINRFNFAYSNEMAEDRLIDYIIAFEALFLKGEEQELSYRLSLRSAVLLGSYNFEKSEVFKNMRQAYALRSGIVHGKDYGKTKKKIEEKLNKINDFLLLIEKYLRVSIISFLNCFENHLNHDSILEELDNEILVNNK
jgi:hypothetical protein